NSLHPDRSHVPIVTSWKHLSEGQYHAAKAAGRLKDTAPATYTILIQGKQRQADVEARLQSHYGKRLERVTSDSTGNTWLLRNEQGEAQLRLVVETKELPIPTLQEAQAIYGDFAKRSLSEIYAWASESNPRGFYAFRVLDMIGLESPPDGQLNFGTRFAELL